MSTLALLIKGAWGGSLLTLLFLGLAKASRDGDEAGQGRGA
jgi:hypothetical protein